LLALTNLPALSQRFRAASGRRVRTRYELHRELRFSYRRGSSLFLGSGRTQDLSDDGIRFESDHQIPQGSEIELRISWPLRLKNGSELVLVARGTILRSDPYGSVLKVNSCEFQTRGDRSFSPDADAPTCSVFA